MKSITRSPNASNNNINNTYFNNYISSSPNPYSDPSMQENNLLNHSKCNCSCHCQEKKCHKFHRDTSCKNIPLNKYKDLNIISISENNATNEKKRLIKHKSQNNLISSPKDKLYLFQELKKNYKPNYNYTTSNKYTSLNNNITYKNNNYSTSINNKLRNHSFVDIKEVSNNSKKDDEIKYYRVQLKRKQLSKFYHNIGLKKYHYGYGKVQTSNKTNNHKYTEINGTSGSNNENTNNKKNIKINYELYTDENNYTNINNINENEKYNNHRYSFSNDFDRNKNYQIKSADKNNAETQSRILKETYNTRLLEVKSPSKEKNYAYNRSTYNLNDTRKNLFNSYQRRTECNNRNNNTNSRFNEYKSNNLNAIKKYNNVYTNKPRLDISNSNEISNNNYKRGSTKYTHIPYALSLGNRLTEQNNMCYDNNNNINNKMNQEKKLNLLRNNRINNINYKILKQKVRLSLLKKQIYEQKRNMLFNNDKGYYNPNLIINDNLCEKTRQLINNDNCTDVINNYDYRENFE